MEGVADQPPSVKLVVKTLQHSGPCDQGELARRTQLPERTARYAVTRAEEAGVVEARRDRDDLRRKVYEIASA
jgi:DNA-binding MarR family transcriptional regulator